MVQTSYKHRKAQAGHPLYAESENQTRTGLNRDPQAKQIETISVGAPGNDETYILLFEDQVEVSFTTDANATQDELVNGLTNAINSEPLVSGTVIAEADTGSDEIVVTARYPGVGFKLEEQQDPSDILSISQTQANAEALPVPFGTALVTHGIQDGNLLVRLPDSADFTARDLQATLDGSTDGDYRLRIVVNGSEYVSEYTASADGEDKILQELRDDINNNGPDLIQATRDTGPTPSELHITPETDGFADFQILGASGSSQINASVATEGDDFRDVLLGLSRLVHTMERTGENDAEYAPNSEITVDVGGGQIVKIEEGTPSHGDPVYVRLKSNGNLDQKGAIRTDWNSGCVPVPEWEVEKQVNGRYAGIILG